MAGLRYPDVLTDDHPAVARTNLPDEAQKEVVWSASRRRSRGGRKAM